jgi:pyruvate/2-oxoglutarate dehydrogenase complex dihydrolipoamide dehydrogenase (E3) component
MAEIPRTKTTSELRGFTKALVGEDDRILGFAAFGADAGEWMGTIQVAMLAGTPYTTVRDAVFAHPTMTEGLNFMFEGLPARDVGEPEYAGATTHRS